MSDPDTGTSTLRLTGGGAALTTHCVHLPGTAPAFDPVLFDRAALERDGRLLGVAGAGRGNTVFVDWHGVELVLREYLRGGAARHLSRRHYLSRGLERSRPVREFRLLRDLETRGLPVSPAYAAQRTRCGPLERGMLITRRVPGETLAARLVATGGIGDDALLAAVGACIARFHRQGVRHADLNAHNIIVQDHDSGPRVTLIDFDRGRIDARPAGAREPARWAQANLQRLARSFDRLLETEASGRVAGQVRAAWRDAHARPVRAEPGRARAGTAGADGGPSIDR